MVPPILRRFPSSLLLALALVTFVGSVLLFTLPFDVDEVGPTNATASCGPPVFEIGASEYATPSTIMPTGTTLDLGPLARLPSTTTTAAVGFGAPVTTLPPTSSPTTTELPTTTVSTIPTELIKQA